METTKRKILLIDGLTTIMNEKYFIKDEVPRVLGDYLDQGFEILLLLRDLEDSTRWYQTNIVPDWMRENILLQSILDFETLANNADQEESMVLTNNPTNRSLYNICGPVKSVEQIFHTDKFPILTTSDFLFCFGWDQDTFATFCETTNCIGIVDEHVLVNSKKGVRPNAMAFWMNPTKSAKESLRKIQLYSEKAIRSNRFKPQHQRNLLGVIYQGKDYSLAKEFNIPLFYI